MWIIIVFSSIIIIAVIAICIMPTDKRDENLCEMLLRNDATNKAVTAMANRISEYIEDQIQYRMGRLQTNHAEEHIVLVVYPSYICDMYPSDMGSAPPSLSVNYANYGIQRIEEPYKLYGLALAVNELLSQKMLALRSSLTEIKSINTKACSTYQRYAKEDSIEIRVDWTVEQNKYIEL